MVHFSLIKKKTQLFVVFNKILGENLQKEATARAAWQPCSSQHGERHSFFKKGFFEIVLSRYGDKTGGGSCGHCSRGKGKEREGKGQDVG